MKEDIAKAWIADLRTNPPQACNSLFDGHGHCCLGRLCVVLGIEPEKIDDHWEYEGRGGVLPESALAVSGIRTPTADGDLHVGGRRYAALTLANDAGRSFSEIADAIERHWPDL